jgi:glycogen debranching enzyme
MDNSPAWDAALARVPIDTQTVVRRLDTSHVDPSMRPHAQDYQRFIHLVDLFRGVGWDAARTHAASPFKVADIGTNAILLRAERDLLALAQHYGSAADRSEIADRIAALQAGIARLFSAEHGVFLSYDLIARETIPAATAAGLLPLFADAATPEQAAAMAGTIRTWCDSAPWPVASADPTAPTFEPRRYWRGPVWAVVNWMIAEGLRLQHQDATADLVRERTRQMIERSGFSEYFDQITEQSLGGARFSWTAAIYLLQAPAGA